MTERSTPTPKAGRTPVRRNTLRWRRYLPSLALLAALLVIWQVVTVAQQVPDYLLPGPVTIWNTAIQEHDLLLQNTVPTLENAVLGYVLAVGLGLLLAVAIRSSRLLDLAVYPIVIGSQAVPLIALAPILVVLFGFSRLPELIVVCLICFFPITVNAVDGFRSVDPDLVNLMRTLGAGRRRLFWTIEWPTALPSIFSGARIAVTFCLVGAIWGERVGSSEGLGWVMTQAQGQLDTAGLFAAMGILVILGISLFVGVSLLERLCLPWYYSDRNLPAADAGRPLFGGSRR